MRKKRVMGERVKPQDKNFRIEKNDEEGEAGLCPL